MKVYFDNNIYNYLVDGQSISEGDIEKLLNAINSSKVEVLFSPVNLFEIVRCYENKEMKAKKMIEISYKLSRKMAKLPHEILLEQFKNSRGFQGLEPYYSEDSLFEQIRKGILNTENYKIPQEFHDDVKKFDDWYCNSLIQMKSNINRMLPEETHTELSSYKNTNSEKSVDFYEAFNSNEECRKLFVEAIFKDRCGFTNQLPFINNFDNIPSFSIFLKFYFKVSYELLIKNKEPKSGDWADLDQTVYFYYVDHVITSDTGKSGLFPNYRDILNQILQPMNKSAMRFSTLISKLEKLK